MCLFHFSIVCVLLRGHSPSFNSAISLSILNVILLVVAELFHAISFIWSCFTFWGLILLSEHSCVVGEGSFGFHPNPIFQLLSLTLERLWLSQSPSNRIPAGPGGTVVSCFLLGSGILSSCWFKPQEFLGIIPTSVPSSASFFQWHFCGNRSHF